MYKKNGTLLIVCPIKNEELGLSRSILSVLSQTYKNFILFIVDNCSEDGSLLIAESFAIQDSRIVVLKGDSKKSVNRSWEFSLSQAVDNFEYEYLMFFAGDDQLLEDSFLMKMVLILEEDPLIYGVVPNFIDQFGRRKSELKFNDSITGNKLELCRDWAYVHAIYGLYRNECWLKIHTASKESFNIGTSFDWWVTFYLFDFRIVSIDSAHYVKFQKSIPYSSSYYISDDEPRENIDGESFTKVNFILRGFRVIFLDTLKRTIRHFEEQPNFVRQNSKILFLQLFLTMYWNDAKKSITQTLLR